MKNFTFDNLKQDKDQGNLFDLSQQTTIDRNVVKYPTVVLQEEEMRLDLVSKRLYGTTIYTEELMILNNIMNQFSIKAGDELLYIKYDFIENMHQLEPTDIKSDKLINPKKNTRVDPKRNKGVIPTIKPIDLEQVILDKKTKTIKINGKIS